MAQLAKTGHKLPDMQLMARDYRETEHHKAFVALHEKHEMVSFCVADGYAHYIVKSRKPLVLQHVDYMDGYQVPAALIRGLRLADIEQNIKRNKIVPIL